MIYKEGEGQFADACPKGIKGTVYLLHFERPFYHAKHYMGWTQGELWQRMKYHRSGNGSRLLHAVHKAGIEWTVARVWTGKTRHFERALKRQRCAPRKCPICSPQIKHGTGKAIYQ